MVSKAQIIVLNTNETIDVMFNPKNIQSRPLHRHKVKAHR